MFPIDFLTKAARAHGASVAFEDAHRSLNFVQLLDDANALAAAIQQLCGLHRPRVAVLSYNSLEMAVAIMAIHAGGFWLIPLNPRNSRAELDAQVAVAEPDLFLIDPALSDGVDTVGKPVLHTRRPTPSAAPAQTQVDIDTIDDLLQAHRGRKPVFASHDPAEPNAIKFTGGSSGRPKAVVQSFRTVNTVVATVATAFELRSDERYLLTAPMTHGAGAFMLPVLSRGGCCVILENPRPVRVVDALERLRITMTWMPPTLLYMLMDVDGVAQRDFSAMRHLIWSGAPASVEKLVQARRIFGNVIESAYGQAEASSVATVIRAHELDAEADEGRLASVGRPTLLSHVEILAPDGAPMPSGEIGEIAIRSDIRMIEYLGMPEATAQVMVDGWVRTGDAGLIDADGYLFIKDRLRDVVISGGFNIYPTDVEDALCRHPAVREVVAFGLPDDKWGERVEAAVELRAGARADAAELAAFARERLGAVKAPKSIHLIDELPRSNVGKVLRRDVRKRFLDLLSPMAGNP